MKAKQTYYKAVRGNLHSASIMHGMSHCINYKIGEWVTPNIAGSKIFVFNNFEDAKRFCSGTTLDIYRCEVRGVSGSPKYMTRSYNVYDAVLAFWKSKNKRNTFNIGLVPLGTVFVDAVKLLEKVY